MIWIRATPASIVNLNLKLPSWLGWMKSFAAILNWSLSPITFSMSLPIVLRRTIGLNDLGESYDFLLDLGMTIMVDFLKCKGQYPSLIQALAILIMTLRHSSSLRITLRWLHDSLSGLGADKLLQLDMANLNSSLEKARMVRWVCHKFLQEYQYWLDDWKLYWKWNEGYSTNPQYQDIVDYCIR